MDISKFAKKPELIKIVIDDPAIIEKYDEEITFYMYDSVDLSTYFDFFAVQQNKDGKKLNELLRKIILTEDGKPALGADELLPVDVCLEALVAINNNLGKSKTKSSTPETGTQSE